MPIEVNVEIRLFSKSEFHDAAHEVMGVVFQVHNDFGRLWREEVFKRVIQRRVEAIGILPAVKEIPINVRFEDFEKRYCMDLLFGRGLMVEVKAVDAFSKVHEAQVLHYLFLAGMQDGLLVNLGRNGVDKRFVSTTLTDAERRRIETIDKNWKTLEQACGRLRSLFLEILCDWGAFLEIGLYRQAVHHFFSTPGQGVQSIPVYEHGIEICTQKMCLIAPDIAVAMTALKEKKSSMLGHLKRVLRHTKLAAIQWINMDNHRIEFNTILQGDDA